MPPALAAQFTTGELAVLRIVADQVKMAGSCTRTVAELAARAGVCLTTVRNAIRAASRLGLVTVEHRQRHRKPNLPNIIRVVSAEWSTWLARGGCRKAKPTDNKNINREGRGGLSSPRTPKPPARFSLDAEETAPRAAGGRSRSR